ncbi:fimbrillin family protein [Bacteroides timonensis]|uniref:fimbrillin family protein n=1 Tax=Bacteroides timonensis TaxID=1470345 RepID=UPI0009DFABE7|nr:fimbrillin family protein [Bacteroides timonensis]
MKKYYLHMVAFLLYFALFAACSGEQIPEQAQDGQTPVTLTADISDLAATRIVNGKWEAGDAIGLCMNFANSTQTANEVFNYCYKVVAASANGQLKPAEDTGTAYFPADGSKVDFLAYHPYRAGSLSETFTLPVDVSAQPATDLLTTRTNGHDRSQPNVALSFKHRLVKLLFTLTGSGIVTNDQLAGATLTIKGMNTKAECLLIDGSITNTSATQDINVPLNATGTAAEAIVLPREAAEGVSYVVTLANGNIYTAYMSASQQLKAGTKNTFRLTLRPVPVTVSASVEPWNDGENTSLTSSVVVVTTSPDASTNIAEGTLMGIRGKGERGTATTCYTYNDNSWSAGDVPLWWDTLGNSTSLYAWMPASADNLPDDENVLSWSIDTNQSKGRTASDLLLSHNIQALDAGQPAALNFQHVLSAVTLTLLPGEGFTADDMKRATLLLNSFPTQISASIATSELTDAKTPEDISPMKEDHVFRAVLIPTTKEEGALIATVSLDGGTYPCRAMTGGFTFATGKHHALKLTLNKTGVSISGSVSEWEEGNNGDFTIQ